MTPNVQYRMVAGKEMFPAAEFLAAKGYPIPNPLLAVAWIAEVDGKVVGALSLDALPMISAIRVEEGHQDNLIGIELFKAAQEWIVNKSEIKTVYAHTAHPTMKTMLKRAGARVTGEEFFVWDRGAN